MNVPQNLAAIFNSPQIAEVQLQAVQAGDMAERQFAETRRQAALRREHQVGETPESGGSGAVDPQGRGSGNEGGRPARRAARPVRPARAVSPAAAEEGPSPSTGGHRVDLVA